MPMLKAKGQSDIRTMTHNYIQKRPKFMQNLKKNCIKYRKLGPIECFRHVTFEDDSLLHASGDVQPSVSSRCRGFLPTPKNFQTKQNRDIKIKPG